MIFFPHLRESGSHSSNGRDRVRTRTEVRDASQELQGVSFLLEGVVRRAFPDHMHLRELWRNIV